MPHHDQGILSTKTNTLYVFEIKFSRNPITFGVIDEVKQKISALKVPKGFSCVPILVHVNGVVDSVIDENYFYTIIEFSTLLER